MRKLLLLFIFFSFSTYGQDYFIVNDGVKTKDYQYNVFINANIHSSKGLITNGTLIEKDGKIIDIGLNLTIPNNSVVFDLDGKFIYPSFIETHSSFGVKKPQRTNSGRSSQYEASRSGYYWNDHILSDYNSLKDYNYNQKDAKGLRDIGFGVVNSHRNDGVHRGTSFTIGLIDNQNESYRIISKKTAEHYSFSKSLTSQQSYPSSTMGAIALIRQLHYDADWYSQGSSESKDLALEALIDNKNLPKLFDANDKLNVYRAAKLSKEFDLNFVIKGSGKEYESIRELKKFNNTLIIPAKSLNLENKIGKIDKGYLSNFLITSGPIFDDKTEINENWIKGQRHIIKNTDNINIDGEYNLTINNKPYEIVISNSLLRPNTKIKRDSIDIKSKTSLVDDWLNITLFDSIDGNLSLAQISSKITSGDNLSGRGIDFKNEAFLFNSSREEIKKNLKYKEVKKSSSIKSFVSDVTFPNVGFGISSTPKSQSIHFKNATIWTNEKEGIIENSDILIDNGKIIAIGQNLETPKNFSIIDASDKHITSGIVDEHSHMAASSINEGGHNSSAEVSIMDVINPDDVNIYRNLAGGVTTVQILHGSANPIGGQSAIIKLKWGSEIDDMFFKDADPFIKFALGENVKQSNWGGSRFPQTRMGVEQVFVDHFDRAKHYGETWDRYNSLSKRQKNSNNKPRYDEELETLWEVINGKRFVSSHSYVQSEINMLMKVAEKFDFRIKIFTHILEGYKVADKMAKHGVGGSTFSDWWGYKFEVNDAIPFNASIMHNAGVTVALNSDNSELSRRLNLEAAKAFKYGNISEEEAWKFVTINPAKLLNLDEKVGSLKVGKDADIVMWSGHPMSLYTKAEKTYIEGALYFDLAEHKIKLNQIKDEKSELIKLMFEENTPGANLKFPNPMPQIEVDCEYTEF